MKIGVMFGNPETTDGGNIKEGETIIGRDTKVKVVKNKVSPPFRQA